MPPKIKISKEEIIQAALELVRAQGEGGINARAIAAALNCSTQPVFSNFASMEDLQEAVIFAAYESYLSFLKKEAESGKYPRYKAFGMAYIRFAKEEKELFRLLFMRDRKGAALVPTPDYSVSVDMIMKANGFSREIADLVHMEMWVSVHGIATITLTSFLSLSEELISNMLTDIYRGICMKHLEKEEEK